VSGSIKAARNPGGRDVLGHRMNAISAGQTRRIVLADMDGDNDLDALIVEKRRAVLWRNDGQGSFHAGCPKLSLLRP
jgi:hypothetical protein